MDLSIIIPVYNGAATICRCLDSIYSQGLDEKQFEVICVDDCSSDLSSTIIEEYKNCHPSNLILLRHEVNKRAGGARNTGIRFAHGEWLMFIDCDDFLIDNSLFKILDASKSDKELELVTYNSVYGTEHSIIKRECHSSNKSIAMKGTTYHINQDGPSLATECIFRRTCFFTKNLWFQENVRFEDVDLVVKFTILAEKVLFLPIDVYYYVKHEGQTTDIKGDYIKIRELFLLANRMACAANEFKEIEKYKENGEHLMHYAALNRILYSKRDLWKLKFRERILLLKSVNLPFDTGYQLADFIYKYPIITSLLLCFLNQQILHVLIKGKAIKRRIQLTLLGR